MEEHKESVLKYIRQFVNLTTEEENFFLSLVQFKSIKKRQFIAQPDYVCKHKTFVCEGAFRGYLICTEGKEHTISFAIENWWITDLNSYLNQQPATLFIEAIENSTVFQIDYNSEQLLLKTYPKFEQFFRILHEQSLAATQRRVISNLTDTAETRYEKFVSQHPKVVNRLPQYAIASYLGFTTEYLSKIRNKRVHK